MAGGGGQPRTAATSPTRFIEALNPMRLRRTARRWRSMQRPAKQHLMDWKVLSQLSLAAHAHLVCVCMAVSAPRPP